MDSLAAVPPIALAHLDDDKCVAACHDVVFLLVRGKSDPDGVDALTAAVRERADATGGPVRVMFWIGTRAALPPSETRRRMPELFHGEAHHIRALSLTLAAEGFAAAAMRGVLTAAVTPLRIPYPLQIFGTVEAAAQWLSRFGHDPREHFARVLAAARFDS